MIDLNLTRLNHVEWALKGNPELHTDTKTKKLDGKKPKDFPLWVWKYAEAIVASGKDPCDFKKQALVAFATSLSTGGVPAAPAETPAINTAQEPETETESSGSSMVNLPVRVAIYTLLASAYELTAHDKKAGHTEVEEAVKKACETVLKHLNPGYTSVVAPVADMPPAEEVAPAPAVSAPPVPSAE